MKLQKTGIFNRLKEWKIPLLVSVNFCDESNDKEKALISNSAKFLFMNPEEIQEHLPN